MRWPSVDIEAAGLVGVTFRIRVEGKKEFQAWGDVSHIPADLAPGEETIVPAVLRSPPLSGAYEIVACTVQIGTDRMYCDTDAPTKLTVP